MGFKSKISAHCRISKSQDISYGVSFAILVARSKEINRTDKLYRTTSIIAQPYTAFCIFDPMR